MGIFCAGKNSKPNPSPLSWLAMFLKRPAHLVYYTTLNFLSQLVGKITKNWSITLEPSMLVLCMPNFRPLGFTGVGGEWGDGHMQDVMPNPYKKFLNSHFASGRKRTVLLCDFKY